ncbi:MAG: putative transrane protein [Herbaspirillum sp.]|nr:putative transrane protein [Herbaspirillum sp.]
MEKISQQKRVSGRWKLALVIAICAAPMLASYLTYYIVKPQARNNYGDLIDPREHPMPDLGARLLDGDPISLDAYKGRWLMIHVDSGDCGDACRKSLYALRQLRTMQGKEMDRIERVWLITDDKPLDTVLMREYDGTRMVRVNAQALKAWLPTESGTQLEDHIYIVDPRGHLMMRFPKNPDPQKVKRDMGKLLAASSIG